MPIARVSTIMGLKYEWSVVDNKKIVSGKINNTPLVTAILRQGWLKKTYGHLYYTQEVLTKSCYRPLTWNGRFQKPVELHSCTGKTEKDHGQTQHNSSHSSA